MTEQLQHPRCTCGLREESIAFLTQHWRRALGLEMEVLGVKGEDEVMLWCQVNNLVRFPPSQLVQIVLHCLQISD